MTRAIFGGLLTSLWLCISHSLLFRVGRPSTATLGLGGDCRKHVRGVGDPRCVR